MLKFCGNLVENTAVLGNNTIFGKSRRVQSDFFYKKTFKFDVKSIRAINSNNSVTNFHGDY